MRLVTVKELSEILSVKEPTLYSWAYNGSIPSYKLNGLLRFDMEEIEKWIEKSRLVSGDLSDLSITPGKTQDIDTLVKKTIARVKRKKYNSGNGEPDQNQGLRKEA